MDDMGSVNTRMNSTDYKPVKQIPVTSPAHMNEPTALEPPTPTSDACITVSNCKFVPRGYEDELTEDDSTDTSDDDPKTAGLCAASDSPVNPIPEDIPDLVPLDAVIPVTEPEATAKTPASEPVPASATASAPVPASAPASAPEYIPYPQNVFVPQDIVDAAVAEAAAKNAEINAKIAEAGKPAVNWWDEPVAPPPIPAWKQNNYWKYDWRSNRFNRPAWQKHSDGVEIYDDDYDAFDVMAIHNRRNQQKWPATSAASAPPPPLPKPATVKCEFSNTQTAPAPATTNTPAPQPAFRRAPQFAPSHTPPPYAPAPAQTPAQTPVQTPAFNSSGFDDSFKMNVEIWRKLNQLESENLMLRNIIRNIDENASKHIIGLEERMIAIEQFASQNVERLAIANRKLETLYNNMDDDYWALVSGLNKRLTALDGVYDRNYDDTVAKTSAAVSTTPAPTIPAPASKPKPPLPKISTPETDAAAFDWIDLDTDSSSSSDNDDSEPERALPPPPSNPWLDKYLNELNEINKAA